MHLLSHETNEMSYRTYVDETSQCPVRIWTRVVSIWKKREGVYPGDPEHCICGAYVLDHEMLLLFMCIQYNTIQYNTIQYKN